MGSQRSILLLNVSNLKSALMYPYAFVQISEIADRYGILTNPYDLYGISKDQWKGYLQKLLQKTPFNMILITLRNTDTLDFQDYLIKPMNYNYHIPTISHPPILPFYYPIEATKHLIQVLRKLTDVPIIIGGYGFSVMPEKLMKYLQPDYGVIGEPDAFFEYFEDVLSGQNLDHIPNLIYSHSGMFHKGPSKFFPPASRCEYTDHIIADRQAFYSRFAGERMELSVPIEVSRGCSKQCSFCSEPIIKGRKVKFRDLDVIEEEINFLRKYQLNQMFFICSEINTESNEFFMSLADRILKINENREEYEKISWYTLHLMTLSEYEIEHIMKAGFRGGSNDVITLGDCSLEAVNPPVKSEEVINFFSLGKKVVKEAFRNNGKKFYSLEERLFKAPQVLNPEDFMNSWNIFLGHIQATPETIRGTLKCADDAGLNFLFDSCYVNKATRIYDYIHPTEGTLQHTWSSVNGTIKNSYNELWPSFTYPPALLRHFGSSEILDDFFTLIGDTYLSQQHLFKKDWNWFLCRNIDPKTFLSWWTVAIKSAQSFDKFTAIPEVLKFLTFLRNNPFIDNIKLLFYPTPGRKRFLNFSANIVIQFILFSLETEIDPIMKHIGLPSLKITLNLSPYKFTSKIFEYYSKKDELYSVVNKTPFSGVLSGFLLEYLLYLNNTPLSDEYKIFFI